MFPLAGIIFLALSFLILVATFIWAAHLLTTKAQQRSQQEQSEAEEEAPEEEPEEEPKEKTRVRGRGYGPSYGLLFGVLACGLFWVSPLMLALSVVGMFFSGRALWEGMRISRTVIYRALVGLVLSVGSVGLHYLKAAGAISASLF